MARPKKVEEVEVEIEVTEETQEASDAPGTPKFPYKFRHTDYSMTLNVVAESVDAGGRTVLHTADGCTYHAPKA